MCDNWTRNVKNYDMLRTLGAIYMFAFEREREKERERMREGRENETPDLFQKKCGRRASVKIQGILSIVLNV